MDIMLDIETMGKTPGSAIVAIGAVRFDPRGDAISVPFRRAIGLRSNVDAGLTMDPDTVSWWLTQHDAARSALAELRCTLRSSLGDFADWLGRGLDGIAIRDETVGVWANGPNFDITLLESAYRACKLPIPWHYRSPRCVRTITAAAGLTKADLQAEIENGTEHDAASDAIWQARAVQLAFRRLGHA